MAADLLVPVTLAVRAAQIGKVLIIPNQQQRRWISVSKILFFLMSIVMWGLQILKAFSRLNDSMILCVMKSDLNPKPLDPAVPVSCCYSLCTSSEVFGKLWVGGLVEDCPVFMCTGGSLGVAKTISVHSNLQLPSSARLPCTVTEWKKCRWSISCEKPA